jgi:hypothetical protein
MVKRLALASMIGAAVASAGVAYAISFHVEKSFRETRELKKEIAENERAIRVARAELAYLSRPDRLKQLNDSHLVLAAPQPGQYMRDTDQLIQLAGSLPVVAEPAPAPVRMASLLQPPVGAMPVALPQAQPVRAPEIVMDEPAPKPQAPRMVVKVRPKPKPKATEVAAAKPAPKAEPKPAPKAPRIELARAEPPAAPSPAKLGGLSAKLISDINTAAEREARR